MIDVSLSSILHSFLLIGRWDEKKVVLVFVVCVFVCDALPMYWCDNTDLHMQHPQLHAVVSILCLFDSTTNYFVPFFALYIFSSEFLILHCRYLAAASIFPNSPFSFQAAQKHNWRIAQIQYFSEMRSNNIPENTFAFGKSFGFCKWTTAFFWTPNNENPIKFAINWILIQWNEEEK